MAKNFCGKCGAKTDAATGLCPNCDAEALQKARAAQHADSAAKMPVVDETKQNPPAPRANVTAAEAAGPIVRQEPSVKKMDKIAAHTVETGKKSGKMKSALTVIICLGLVAVMVYLGVANTQGWWPFAKMAAEKRAVRTACVTYINQTILPAYGLFDTDQVAENKAGLFSGLFIDLDEDGDEEMVALYSDRSDAMHYNIVCLNYAGEEAAEPVTVLGTLNIANETDTLSIGNTESGEPYSDVQIYTNEYGQTTYVIFERIDYNDTTYRYESHIFAVEDGAFTEVGNIFSERPTENGRIVYSTKLPGDLVSPYTEFDAEQSGFAQLLQEKYIDPGYTVLYYSEAFTETGDGSGYEYTLDYDSENSALTSFLDNWGIFKEDIVQTDTTNGHKFALETYENVDMIFTYTHYTYTNDSGELVDNYNISDYTDLKNLLAKYTTTGEEEKTQVQEDYVPDVYEMIRSATSFTYYYYQDINYDQSVVQNGTTYYLYDDDTIKTWDDFCTNMGRVYSQDAVEDYFGYVDYLERDDGLYVTGGDRGSSAIYSYITYEKTGRKKYLLTIYTFNYNSFAPTETEVTLVADSHDWYFEQVLEFDLYDSFSLVEKNSDDYPKWQRLLAYSKVLQQNLDVALDEISDVYAVSTPDDVYMQYGLYDITGDGVKELLVDVGQSESARKYRFYTCENDEAVLLGEASAFHASLYAADGVLVACAQFPGANEPEYTQLALENGQITETVIALSAAQFERYSSVTMYSVPGDPSFFDAIMAA